MKKLSWGGSRCRSMMRELAVRRKERECYLARIKVIEKRLTEVAVGLRGGSIENLVRKLVDYNDAVVRLELRIRDILNILPEEVANCEPPPSSIFQRAGEYDTARGGHSKKIWKMGGGAFICKPSKRQQEEGEQGIAAVYNY